MCSKSEQWRTDHDHQTEKKTGSSIPRLSIRRENVELAVRGASVDVGEGRKSSKCRTIGMNSDGINQSFRSQREANERSLLQPPKLKREKLGTTLWTRRTIAKACKQISGLFRRLVREGPCFRFRSSAQVPCQVDAFWRDHK
jgi:hypothetical protein